MLYNNWCLKQASVGAKTVLWCTGQSVSVSVCTPSLWQVVDQPHARVVTVLPPKPNNYLGLSIFTLLCCCWLFGIIALIYALQVCTYITRSCLVCSSLDTLPAQVDSAYASGDVVSATSASRSSRKWNIAGIVFGSVVVLAVVLYLIIATIVQIALSLWRQLVLLLQLVPSVLQQCHLITIDSPSLSSSQHYYSLSVCYMYTNVWITW